MKDTVSLTVSCVYFDTQETTFENTLNSLAGALENAVDSNIIDSFELHLINNNPQREDLFFNVCTRIALSIGNVMIHNGHGNIGYGRANNLAINQIDSKYHLILNPDVELFPNTLIEGLRYLETNKHVSLIAPHATNQLNQFEYLAKRQPTFFTILLRGLNNSLLNRFFSERLERYSYMDLIPNELPIEIELASGCFMLCRSELLKASGGFSPEYFLYFEDFDLSKKISEYGKIFYLPTMKIRHLGGNSAKKGLKHIRLFLFSYLLFRTCSK